MRFHQPPLLFSSQAERQTLELLVEVYSICNPPTQSGQRVALLELLVVRHRRHYLAHHAVALLWRIYTHGLAVLLRHYALE